MALPFHLEFLKFGIYRKGMTVGERHPEPELAEVKACPAALRGISYLTAYETPRKNQGRLYSVTIPRFKSLVRRRDLRKVEGYKKTIN